MKSSSIEQAQQLIQALLSWQPHNQYLWAIQGSLWKLQGDSRYTWLVNYDYFLSSVTIDCPDGYRSLGEFLEELSQYLYQRHFTRQAPTDQTLVGGTQIPGRLFKTPNSLIKSLVTSISSSVDRYISELPEDLSHPFLSRKTQLHKFQGSWSVVLKKGGYHVSHVHPLGWISSSFYVRVPEQLPMNEGWIGFGKSSFELGSSDVIERLIEPTPGLLVLFPSYFWHETIPMGVDHEDCLRITTPFDVVPEQQF